MIETTAALDIMSDSDGQFEVTVIKLLLLMIYYATVIQAEGYHISQPIRRSGP
jgi:hypothetical protein